MSVSLVKLLTVLKSKFRVRMLKDLNQNVRSSSREATSHLLTQKKCIDLSHQWRISCFIVVSGQTLQRQTDLLTTNYTDDSSNKTGCHLHMQRAWSTVSQGKLQRVHREVWLWSFIRWLNLLVTKLRVTVSFLSCLYTIISSYSPIICNRQVSYVTHNSALHWFSFFLFVCFFYVFELFDGNALKSTSVDFSVGGSTDC